MTSTQLLDVRLARIVMRDSSDRQYIYLEELGVETPRGFPIVIGTQEADEIYRVVHQIEPQRPLTHMLAFQAIGALDAKVVGVDIVALQHNTFFARIELERADGKRVELDARPSDAIAIGMRAKARLRVKQSVLEEAVAENESE